MKTTLSILFCLLAFAAQAQQTLLKAEQQGKALHVSVDVEAMYKNKYGKRPTGAALLYIQKKGQLYQLRDELPITDKAVFTDVDPGKYLLIIEKLDIVLQLEVTIEENYQPSHKFSRKGGKR